MLAVAASDGSPALAESLLVEGVWERGGRAGASGRKTTVPWARLELISGPARAWLECVAVLRTGVRDAHAAALSGLDPASTRAAADEANAAGLVYRKEGRWFLDSGALADQLISQVEPGRRGALHRAAHEFFNQRGDKQ